ncbi:hypothetical protein [Methylobacter svalbardensis]|uniref:hypothetical protein n=1 Tax=Methylobacter svalbardensis TaxID=3080016 RepID=UPI0030ED9EF2
MPGIQVFQQLQRVKIIGFDQGMKRPLTAIFNRSHRYQGRIDGFAETLHHHQLF